ncbi:hypothetical protein STRIP9103_07212 [Streptomyces ipomoeae 91-03]|uniref:Uncharacterized protein n=1 Tax=Streptomyces ipomoeae 91-03 TaxID=698759 RepID=L1L2W6_9ACTN|nr:hypothetical protein STRIP9103_07212 [Streptomyces ipomoeae 91-03]
MCGSAAWAVSPPTGADMDGNTPVERIPFDLTHALPTTAHAAEESPG